MRRVLYALTIALGFGASSLGAYSESGTGLLGKLDFTPNGTQPGLDFPIDSPNSCSTCHAGFQAPDTNIMPHSTWSGSMMANATRDPLFWAALDVANRDVPGVGDFCLRCHTPTGWLAGRVGKTGNPEEPFIDGTNGCRLSGSLTAADEKDNDYSGIGCAYCHRAEERGPQNEPTLIGNANLWLDDSSSCQTELGSGFFGPCRKGPYRDYEATAQPPHGWEFSSYLQSSAFCGSCHDVSTPDTDQGPLKTLIDENGQDTGLPYPIERTYTEWTQSLFADVLFADGFRSAGNDQPALARGQTCQGCHMPDTSDPLARACTFDEPGRRTNNLGVHDFVGANAWIPRILRDEYDLQRDAAFNRTMALANQMLTEHSAEIDMIVGSPDQGLLPVAVTVTNKTGHKLPTGYAEGRRMWIHVQALDGNLEPFWESGAYDLATGELTQDEQIKVYEVQQGIWNRNGDNACDIDDGKGRKLFHFVLNNCILSDNRIPPLGFLGGNSLETQPVGYSYPETAPGSGRLVNFDTTNYQVPIPEGTPLPISVNATLKFQISSKEYIEFLRDEAITSKIPSENLMCDRQETIGPADQTRGAYMFDLWTRYDRSPPVDMVSISAASAAE